MRSQAELYGAIDSIGVGEVDPDLLFAKVEAGAAARQRAWTRRLAVGCVSAASVVIAAAAIVVPTLANDNADGGRVATTPTSPPAPGPTNPTADQPPLESASPTIGFTPGPAPAGYATTVTYIQPGLQSFTFESTSDSQPAPQIKMDLFDPELSGLPSPPTTGETLSINSATQGPLTVQVLDDGPTVPGELTFGIGWKVDSDTWFTISSNAPGDQVREQVLAAAEQVDLTVGTPLTFPFQVGVLPDGFQPNGGGGVIGSDGRLQANLDLADDPLSMIIALQISADNAPDALETFTPNTTVGPYQAQLSGDELMGTTLAVLIDGFVVSLYVNEEYTDQIDEDAIRAVAESLVVIDGAAENVSVWTDQPLG